MGDELQNDREPSGDDERREQDPEHREPLVRGLLAGDEEAYAEMVAGYAGRLRRLADRKLSPVVRRRVEAEDIVQSVCRTFFRRAGEGMFDVPDEARLWSLLCAITVAKTNEKLRFHKRQRRDPNREQHFESVSPDGNAPCPQPASDVPTADQEVAFAEQFEQIIAALDDEERRILEFKLQGAGDLEIAKELACSERTVRRILKRLQDRFESEFG